MSGGEVLAAALCALGAAVLGTLVKRGSKEYALLLSAGAAVLILTAALGGAVPLVESLRELAGGDSLGGRCMEAMLREGCVGQLPEIYDGGEPGPSKGCFAQAWSVGELLRVYEALERIEG